MSNLSHSNLIIYDRVCLNRLRINQIGKGKPTFYDGSELK